MAKRKSSETSVETKFTKRFQYTTAYFASGEYLTVRVVDGRRIEYVYSSPRAPEFCRADMDGILDTLFVLCDEPELPVYTAQRFERTLLTCRSVEELLARARRYPMQVVLSTGERGEIRSEQDVYFSRGFCGVWLEKSWLVPARCAREDVQAVNEDGSLRPLD